MSLAATVAIGAVLALQAAVPALAADRLSGESDVVVTVLKADDPTAAYGALSAADRAEFDFYMLPVEPESPPAMKIEPHDAEAFRSARQGLLPESALDVTATGCWLGRSNDSRKAPAGNTLYTFFTTLRWCASGSTVTSATLYEADGETSTPGWRYDGVRARNWGIINNTGRAYARHRFVLGIGGYDVKTDDNCLRVTGFAAGNSGQERVCSIS